RKSGLSVQTSSAFSISLPPTASRPFFRCASVLRRARSQATRPDRPPFGSKAKARHLFRGPGFFFTQLIRNRNLEWAELPCPGANQAARNFSKVSVNFVA